MLKEKKNITQESVDELKAIPTGKEFTNLYNLYKVIPSNLLPSYINAFDRKLSAGYNGSGKDCYGQGAYLNFDIKNAITLLGSWNYGDCIIQVKLLGGFKNFLFFDTRYNSFIADLCAKTYGRPMSVEEQLLEITKDPNIARRYASDDASYFGRYSQSKIRREGYNIRGMVYDWGSGHPVALPFNFGDVITCAAAPHLSSHVSVDDVKRALKGVLDDKSRKTQSEWFDTVPQMEMLNANKENMPYKRCKLDGCIYVPYEKKGGGKFNLVRIDEKDPVNPKPEFIIPFNVKLDEMPSLPDDEGVFYFSVSGISFGGIVRYSEDTPIPAYWCEEDQQWYSFKDFDYGFNLAAANKRVAESVKEEKRKIIKEAFSPDMTAAEFFSKNGCIVYTCTHADSVSGIFKNGFSRQYAAENDRNYNGGRGFYGNGVYGSVSLGKPYSEISSKGNLGMNDAGAIYLSSYPDGSKSDGFKYGPVILKCILLGGWNNFLIFDERLARIVYKDNWTIDKQIGQIVGSKDSAAAQTLFNAVRHNTRYNVDSSDSRTTQALAGLFRGSQAEFDRWEAFFRKFGIRGAIYHGGNDGYAFVCYNYSEVVPVAASYDHGKTFTNKDFDYETTKSRLSFDGDMQAKVGHIYKKVSKFSKKVECNGKIFGLTLVETRNGKFNFVFTDGKKLSKFDFDSEPTVSQDGVVEFEYGGYTMQGVVSLEGADVPAFWFAPNENWYSFDDLQDVLTLYKNDQNN